MSKLPLAALWPKLVQTDSSSNQYLARLTELFWEVAGWRGARAGGMEERKEGGRYEGREGGSSKGPQTKGPYSDPYT